MVGSCPGSPKFWANRSQEAHTINYLTTCELSVLWLRALTFMTTMIAFTLLSEACAVKTVAPYIGVLLIWPVPTSDGISHKKDRTYSGRWRRWERRKKNVCATRSHRVLKTSTFVHAMCWCEGGGTRRRASGTGGTFWILLNTHCSLNT